VRLLLDTNVLLAAYLTRGVCHDLLEHCRRSHQIITSDRLLREFEAKLIKKVKAPAAKAQAAVAMVRSEAELVTPSALAEPVCRDPDDDWVLAAAVAGTCACIVTGDQDLLVLTSFAGIRILSPREFWQFESQASETVSGKR
jgi:putative PIN family toxin of toxin-antitoxin system